jgi:hypothetical protein
LGSTVSECELLINVVMSSKPKALLGLSQKAYSRLSLSYVGTHGLTTVGEKAEPNLLLLFYVEHSKPDCPPASQFIAVSGR